MPVLPPVPFGLLRQLAVSLAELAGAGLLGIHRVHEWSGIGGFSLSLYVFYWSWPGPGPDRKSSSDQDSFRNTNFAKDSFRKVSFTKYSFRTARIP